MRRYRAISPVFGDYQDLGLQAKHGQFRVAVLAAAQDMLANAQFHDRLAKHINTSTTDAGALHKKNLHIRTKQ